MNERRMDNRQDNKKIHHPDRGQGDHAEGHRDCGTAVPQHWYRKTHCEHARERYGKQKMNNDPNRRRDRQRRAAGHDDLGHRARHLPTVHADSEAVARNPDHFRQPAGETR